MGFGNGREHAASEALQVKGAAWCGAIESGTVDRSPLSSARCALRRLTPELVQGRNDNFGGVDPSRLRRVHGHSVDLDHSAVNTVGIAIETRRWVTSRGFGSLIVVTSNYHMPRTMAELARQLPHTTLIPFPVVSDRQRAEHWWTSPLATRLLLLEYLKYIYAKLRIGLEPVFAGEDGKAHLAGR